MVSSAEFVAVWMRAKNMDEVAAKTGLRRRGASVRACRLRRLGVKLKHFPRGKRTVLTAKNIRALNTLIRAVARKK